MAAYHDAPARQHPGTARVGGLLIAQFLVGMTSTLIATSLPSIRQSLSMSLTEASWLVTVTILGNCATSSLWAKWGNRFNRSALTQAALLVYGLSTLFAVIAWNSMVLLIARLLQGVGIAGMLICSAALVAQVVAPRFRGRVNGQLMTVQMAGMFLGPIIGGLLTESPWGWRAAFGLCIPAAVVALLLVRIRFVSLTQEHTASSGRPNWVGSVLIPLGLASTLAAITLGAESSDFSVVGILAAGGLTTLTVAVITECFSRNPIVPLRLLSDWTLSGSALVSFCIGFTQFGSAVYASQYAQDVLGMDAVQAGFMLAPMAVGMAVTAKMSALWMDRTGRTRVSVVAGLLLFLAGYVGLTFVDSQPELILVVGLALVGAGFAAVGQNLVLIAHNAVGQSVTSSAGGLVLLAQALGGATGMAASGALLASLAPHGSTAVAAEVPWLFAGYGAVTLIALGIAFTIRVPPLRETVDKPPAPQTT